MAERKGLSQRTMIFLLVGTVLAGFAIVFGTYIGAEVNRANDSASVEEAAEAPTAPKPYRPAAPAKPVVLSCDAAMADAASVSASETNDREFAVTARSCATADEWSAAFLRYPGAAGLSSVSASDVPVYLSVVCATNGSTALCRDAVATGVIS